MTHDKRDIVERLRGWPFPPPVMIEAADEIERLRATIALMNAAAASLVGGCACRFDDQDNPIKECSLHAGMRARIAGLEEAHGDEVLASVSPENKARREWCSGSTWLYPGDKIVVIRPRTSPPKEGT